MDLTQWSPTNMLNPAALVFLLFCMSELTTESSPVFKTLNCIVILTF